MTDRLARFPGTSVPTDRVEWLINEQRRIMEKQLDLMRSVKAAHESAHGDAVVEAGVEATPDFKRVPMTDVQRDVWIICQLSKEGSAAYNLSTTLRLKGHLDAETLHESLRCLVLRHEALRTTFDAAGDHQIVYRTIEVGLSVVDISEGQEHERAKRLAANLDSELTAAYDLVTGPLFRAALIRTGVADHTLVLSAHHLVCDGSSLGVMQRDLSAIYSSLIKGERAHLEYATQFSEYVTWREDQSAESEPYWLGLFKDPPVQLDLPADRARLPTRTFEYGTEQIVLGQELLAALKEAAVAAGVTPFILLLAAWEVLLHRLSGQGEFASGVYVAGQPSMGARDLVGLCANLLPLRVRISPDEPLFDYLARLKRNMFDAFDNQHYSIGKLASALHLPRDASRPTVVSSVITLETPTQGIDFEGLEAIESSIGRRFGSFDFEVYLTESMDDLTVDFQYSKAILDSDTIRRWLGYYIHLLRQMTIEPTARVADLRLFDDAERRELLTRWNDTAAPIPEESTPERIERQVARHPDRVAITGSSGTLTYGELNAKANRLARHLRDLGVKAERVVGVNLRRSPEIVIALLAIHKAGGAFVPLDPSFPPERLAMIAADTGLDVLLTEDSLLGTVVAEGAAIVVLSRDDALIEAYDAADLGITPGPSDLAYVIFTSGSTGKPKGVEIEHRSLTNQLESMRQRPGLVADDVLLSVTTMSFDPALLEFFLPLMVGATIVLADTREAGDATWLRARLAQNDITVMQATPATWQMLVDAGWAGTPGLKVLCGGEALSDEQSSAITSRVDSLWNVYGTTEGTIWQSSVQVSREGGLIPIGDPIANTTFHVLDPWLEPQPPGVIGVLYSGGVGVGRGYRRQPGLTQERFIVHSFDGEPPQRYYRTGDLGRRLADGRIEFLGRDDFQVKIRGFRIELGEIETILARHPGVRECAVVARSEADGRKRLVAYVVPTTDRHETVSELRMYLREFLPDYMVPSGFVELEALPLSANRKVDRARLPDPDHQRPELAAAFINPRTEMEALLARIWEKLLDLEQVGIEDNFFDLGGDSLSALRCIIQVNRSGISLALNSIFRYQTIAELSIAATEASEAIADDKDVETGPTPLTPAQLRFLNERNTPDPQHWNVSTLVQADRLSPTALRTAVAAVLRHHDALRLRLWPEEGRWQQEIAAPSEEIPFESHDLSGLSAQGRIAAIESICSGLQESFDLGHGLLLRVAHFDCGPDEPDRLFVTIHHFAVDGLTWAVFWEDLGQAYRQAVEGVSVSLPPKTTSFQAWATQLEHLARTPRVLDAAVAWMRLPWNEVADMPVDFEMDPRRNTNQSAAAVEFEFSSEDTSRLLASRERPEHVIITALAHCLSTWTASPTVLIDVLSHGRDAAFEGVNLSRTVGFMLSYNPLVLSHPTWAGTPEVLESVAKQIEAGPEGFSFELLRFLAPDQGLRDRLTRLPRAELLFNYAGAEAGPEDDAFWSPATEPTGPDRSPRGLRQHPIAVRATLTPNLRLTFVYSTELHTAATIEVKVAEVVATIRTLVDASPVPSERHVDTSVAEGQSGR